jgi:aryl-alcohol dehydrogenase-like predicted oxidoreductase
MSSSSGETERKQKIVFGTAALGMAYGLPRVGTDNPSTPSEDEVQSLIDYALERGLDTFDTAPAYGESEARLGRALAGRGRVWTKVLSGDPCASLVTSLDRLKRSHVDALQWHNWKASLAEDPMWRDSWLALRGDPRVKELGATTYGREDARAALESGLFDIVQVEFNLLNQGVVELLATLMEGALFKKTRVTVRSVYLQGALTDEGRALPANRPTLASGVARARAVAGKNGLTHLALKAALDHHAIDNVVVGFDRAEQIHAALVLAERDLSPDVQVAIESLDLGGDPAVDPRTWR